MMRALGVLTSMKDERKEPRPRRWCRVGTDPVSRVRRPRVANSYGDYTAASLDYPLGTRLLW